jgi:hypothetical protein
MSRKASGFVYGQRGVSVLETMVAASLGMMILGAAADVFMTHHRHFIGQKTKAELQQDLRGGIGLMATELRLASVILKAESNEVVFQANVNTVQGTTTVMGMPAQNVLQVTAGSGWVRGKSILLCSPMACEDHLLERDGTSGHLTLSTPLNREFAVGSRVEVINRVRYFVSRSRPDNPKLMREVDQGTNPLIEHVDAFSLVYLKENGRPAAGPEEIRLVRVTLATSGIDGRGGRYSRHHTRDMGVRAL